MTTYHVATPEIMRTKASIQRHVNDVFKGYLGVKKLLRVQVDSKTYRRKDGYQLHVFSKHMFINIDIDKYFEIKEDDNTFTIENSKVCVIIWKNGEVTPSIYVY